MKRSMLDRAAWAIAGALAIALVGTLAGVVQGGPLDPPNPPGSTLPQVEPRIPISSLPFTADQPGSYFLTKTLTGVASQDGITVTADHVTIDLDGFALIGADLSGSGVNVPGARSNVEVRNGTIAGWGAAGIIATTSANGRFSALRLEGNGDGGIRAGLASELSSVVAHNNSGPGIVTAGFATIRDSTATFNDGDGIQVNGGGSFVRGNTVFQNFGVGIHSLAAGTRIDGNNVGLNSTAAIKVEGTSNVIIRNTVYGAPSDIDIPAGNTKGPTETAGDPISNPWANIAY